MRWQLSIAGLASPHLNKNDSKLIDPWRHWAFQLCCSQHASVKLYKWLLKAAKECVRQIVRGEKTTTTTKNYLIWWRGVLCQSKACLLLAIKVALRMKSDIFLWDFTSRGSLGKLIWPSGMLLSSMLLPHQPQIYLFIYFFATNLYISFWVDWSQRERCGCSRYIAIPWQVSSIFIVLPSKSSGHR